MKTLLIISKILLLSTNFLVFSCSSINKNSTNQSLEVKKVEPLAQITSAVEKSNLSTNLTLPSQSNLKEKREIKDEDIFESRNLSEYKVENTSDCNTYKCVQRRMRNFIWTHWQNKKRGYIKNHLTGIDVSITDHIFIEPDTTGNWRIVWKVTTRNISNSNIRNLDEISSVVKTKKSKGKLILKNKDNIIVREL